MRIFVAVQPTEPFREALADVQDRLRSAGVRANWLTPDNLHMTLAFIGEWPEDVTRLLPAAEQPFAVTLSHVGVFSRAKVIWAGVEPSPDLDRLAQRVRDSLSAAGIPFDPRPFVPHITLGRKPLVPEGLDLAEIPVPGASMTVTEACLYRSYRQEAGMTYEVIGHGGMRNA